MKLTWIIKNYVLPFGCSLLVLIYLYTMVNGYVFTLNNSGRVPEQNKWSLLAIAIFSILLLILFVIFKKTKNSENLRLYILIRLVSIPVSMVIFNKSGYPTFEFNGNYSHDYGYYWYWSSDYRHISLTPTFFFLYTNSLIVTFLVRYLKYLLIGNKTTLRERLDSFKKNFFKDLPMLGALECLLLIGCTIYIIFKVS